MLYSGIPTEAKYLVLYEDGFGKIKRADLALFYEPKNALIPLPKNSFFNVYHSNPVSIDGTFTLITLEDIKQYEIDYQNGKKLRMRSWQSKAAETIPNVPPTQTCVQWTLEIITYNGNDEIVEITDYDLGVTCTGGYTVGNGGDGGDDAPNPTPAGSQVGNPGNATDLWYVTQNVNNGWGIQKSFSFTGTIFRNTANNRFSGVTASCASGYGYCGDGALTWAAWYGIWTPTIDNAWLLNGNRNAASQVQGSISFPNQTINNFIGIAQTKNWPATILQ